MSRRRPKDPGQLGFFERIMFTFMGPPQLGDVNAPSTLQRDPADDLCRKCGEPWDAHERVSTGSMTYAVCPTAQD